MLSRKNQCINLRIEVEFEVVVFSINGTFVGFVVIGALFRLSGLSSCV